MHYFMTNEGNLAYSLQVFMANTCRAPLDNGYKNSPTYAELFLISSKYILINITCDQRIFSRLRSS